MRELWTRIAMYTFWLLPQLSRYGSACAIVHGTLIIVDVRGTSRVSCGAEQKVPYKFNGVHSAVDYASEKAV